MPLSFPEFRAPRSFAERLLYFYSAPQAGNYLQMRAMFFPFGLMGLRERLGGRGLTALPQGLKSLRFFVEGLGCRA